jgi:Tol biopolymer transport system component
MKIGKLWKVFGVVALAVGYLVPLTPQPPRQSIAYRSKITIYDLTTRSTEVIYQGDGIIEAPNWSRDGSYLLVNSGGNLHRLYLEGPGRNELRPLDLGDAGYRANNDHDLTSDGKLLAFSASTPSAVGSRVYVANADGSNVRVITPDSPSYFHGWSPDGRYVAYVARRGERNFEIYRAPIEGGAEEQLTFAGGYDDGPEYTPDGRWIYFNSNRSGKWEIWRMPADGAGPNDERAERVTEDSPEDWFPHISPDGAKIVFLSFPEGTQGHGDRMEGVTLRMTATPGENSRAADIETLLTFFGGQGSINVNSWAPDSTRFAFVQFEPAPPQ